jgi:hypothetical protein
VVARIEPGIVRGGLVEREPRIDDRRVAPHEQVVDTGCRPLVDGRCDEPASERPRVTAAGFPRRRPETSVEQQPEGWLVRLPIQVSEEDGRIGRRQRRQPCDDRPSLTQARDVAGWSVGVMEMGVGDGQRSAASQTQPERLDDPEVRQPPDLVESDHARRPAREEDDAVPVARVSRADGLRSAVDRIVEIGHGRGERAILVDRAVHLLEADDVRGQRPELGFDQRPTLAPAIALRVVEQVERREADVRGHTGGRTAIRRSASPGPSPGDRDRRTH